MPDSSALAGGRIRSHVNPTGFAEHPQYLRGILLHEVHHVVLGHLTPRFRGRAWPKLMEIALEVSANEDIREQPPPLSVPFGQLVDDHRPSSGQGVAEPRDAGLPGSADDGSTEDPTP